MLPRKTKAARDWLATGMNINRTQCPELAKWLVDKLADGKSVLDIGCGNKWWHPFVKASKIVTVDGWEKCNPDFLLNLEETDRLPFDDCSFDIVTMLDLIEHLSLESGLRLLKETKRVGKVIILLTPIVWDKNIQKSSWYYGNDPAVHKSLWTPEQFKEADGWKRCDGLTSLGGYYLGVWERVGSNAQ